MHRPSIQQNGQPTSGLGLVVIKLLGLLIAGWFILACVQFMRFETGFVTDFVRSGVQFQGGTAAFGYAGSTPLLVKHVDPGSPGEQAGLRPGDAVRFADAFDNVKIWPVEGKLRITLQRGTQTLNQEIIVPRAHDGKPAPYNFPVYKLAFESASLLSALLGLFILLRSRQNLPAALLGLVLIGNGYPGSYLPPFHYPEWLVPYLAVITFLIACFATCGFYAWALVFAGERSLRLRVADWAGLSAIAGGVTLLLSLFTLDLLGCVHSGIDWGVYLIAIAPVPLVLAQAYLWLGWRRSKPAERPRSLLLFLGVLAWLISFLANVIGYELAHFATALGVSSRLGLVVAQSNPVFGYCGFILLTVAILRHRIYNLGFAINRTVVFATISAIMLAGFGVVEWAADHFIPVDGREKNVIVDAAVALGIYLTFHTLHTRIERTIERLFFHHWHEAETQLRRFVRDAAFITQPDTLITRFAGALQRFNGGADVAIYLQDAMQYRRVAGEAAGLPAQLDPDTAELVLLRAESKPVDGQDKLEAGLWVPILTANATTGAIVLGPKPDAALYRPAERDLALWAATEVSLHLTALELRAAAQERSALLIERNELRALVAAERNELRAACERLAGIARSIQGTGQGAA